MLPGAAELDQRARFRERQKPNAFSRSGRAVARPVLAKTARARGASERRVFGYPWRAPRFDAEVDTSINYRSDCRALV